MKKFLNIFLFASLLVAGLAGLAACSSDDDDDDDGGSSLEAPEYESVSAKYVILSDSSSIQSVELTESGNYVIVMRPYYEVHKAIRPARQGMLRKLQGATRAASSRVIEGKYTKLSDTEFLLEGYGHISISGTADDAVALVITPNAGGAFTLHAARTEQKSDSELTSKLCRTWNISSLQFQVYVGGKKFMDAEHKTTELGKFKNDFADFIKKLAAQAGEQISEKEALAIAEELFGEELDTDEDDQPTQVIFTKAGSYMVQYADGELALSTWAWADESKGLLRYSWSYDNFYDEDESGQVEVFFRSSQLGIREQVGDEDEEEVYVTYYMNEAK